MAILKSTIQANNDKFKMSAAQKAAVSNKLEKAVSSYSAKLQASENDSAAAKSDAQKSVYDIIGEMVETASEDNAKQESVSGIKVTSVDDEDFPNSADHPYIVDLGGHQARVGENILFEQMSFRKFKNAITAARLGADVEKAERIYWGGYGMLPNQVSAFEQAILRGMKLNYDAIANDFNAMANGEGGDFFQRFESLNQLCHLKLIESKLLSICDDDIQRERDNGEVTLYQNIITATEYIYMLYAMGLAEFTTIMQTLSFDGYFKRTTEKGIFKTEEVECSKEEVLDSYLELPKILTNQCIEFAYRENLPVDGIKQLYQVLDNMVNEFSAQNEKTIKNFRDSILLANGENGPYIKSDKYEHDRMFS